MSSFKVFAILAAIGFVASADSASAKVPFLHLHLHRQPAPVAQPAEDPLITRAKDAVRKYLTQNGGDIMEIDLVGWVAKLLGDGRVGVGVKIQHEDFAMWHDFIYDSRTGKITRRS